MHVWMIEYRDFDGHWQPSRFFMFFTNEQDARNVVDGETEGKYRTAKYVRERP